jgi:SAM-dependent methyltransferase
MDGLGSAQAPNTTPVTHLLQPRASRRISNTARFSALRPYLEGRRVLDLGAARGIHSPGWFHGRVCEVAAETVALDLDAEGISEVQRRGLQGVVGDATDFELGTRYEVVLAGELIEHLVDIAGFFRCVQRHLEPGGKVLLTTPNAFALTNFLYRLGERPAPINPDHTCWFCEDTLPALLVKGGFRVETLTYVRHDTPGRARKVVASAVRKVLPERLAWRTLLVVATPTDP